MKGFMTAEIASAVPLSVDNRSDLGYLQETIDALRRTVKRQEVELEQLRHDNRILLEENAELQGIPKPQPRSPGWGQFPLKAVKP